MNELRTGFRPRLKERLREALVVVASILVAFALDAWWDQSVESRQAAEIVTSLEAEFSTRSSGSSTCYALRPRKELLPAA